MRNSLLQRVRNCSIAASLVLQVMGVASPAAAEEKLVVWWNKGYYKAEEDALLEVIKKFEAKSGVKVELSEYAKIGRAHV